MRIPRAWILTLGNEVLIGEVENTNSRWLAERLTSLGFAVRRICTGPDDEESIELIKEAVRANVELLVTTGGLGPTYDDRTMELVAKALGLELELNRKAEEMVRRRLAERGFEVTPYRLKMAYMPRGAEPLGNSVGTAPGAVLRGGSTLMVVLPGVPKEMEAMFQEAEDRYLRSMGVGSPCRREALVEGLVEADLADVLLEVSSRYPGTYVKTQPRGSPGSPAVRILVLSFEGAEACSSVIDRLLRAALERGGRPADLSAPGPR